MPRGTVWSVKIRVFKSSAISIGSFFFNDTATTEIYTLSLHDALPISFDFALGQLRDNLGDLRERTREDRKSTRLNSSHITISYAVCCLKKKKTKKSAPRSPVTQKTPKRLTNKLEHN